MSLNIMIAGCSKDEREHIEAAVRAAFNGRPDNEPWNISLVNVANQWSVDIDGPDPQFKSMSLVTPTSDLTSSLTQALGSAAPAEISAPSVPEAAPLVPEAAPLVPEAAPLVPEAAPPENGASTPPVAPLPGGNGADDAAGGARQDRHQCEECAASFEVIFDKLAGESEDLCPVACPACWHVNRVPIAEAAGATGDYRAQTV